MRVGVRLTDQTHVVAQVDGQPLQPNSLTHEFVRLLAKASDLPRNSLPRLETHARDAFTLERRSSQGGAGAPRSFERGVTLDLYSHVLPGMQEDAAAKVDAAIRAAIDAS